MPFEPAYFKLGIEEIENRARKALELLSPCRLCPRRCGAKRLEGETGFCRVGRLARVASYGPHHGEERPLSGQCGSGTIFFGGCNLRCSFCQNHDISQHPAGREVDAEDLASIMLTLQSMGCHNINLVTPTHVVPQILEALALAMQKGLSLLTLTLTLAQTRMETGIVILKTNILPLHYCRQPTGITLLRG